MNTSITSTYYTALARTQRDARIARGGGLGAGEVLPATTLVGATALVALVLGGSAFFLFQAFKRR